MEKQIDSDVVEFPKPSDYGIAAKIIDLILENVDIIRMPPKPNESPSFFIGLKAPSSDKYSALIVVAEMIANYKRDA